MRIGAVLSVVGAIFIVYYLHRHGAAGRCPRTWRDELFVVSPRRASASGICCEACGSVLAPLLPGLILFYLASILAHPEHTSRGLWLLAGSLVFFVLIGELNRYAAKKIQARIDALERNT